MKGKEMKITFCLFIQEGKQYMSVAENNTGKEHEIFLGDVDEMLSQLNFVGTLDIPKNISEKERIIRLIGKILISIKLVLIS
jgi:hypothetical protein